MRWGKILLLFQAVVTLIIGMAFFSQLTKIGVSDTSNIISELSKNNTEDGIMHTLDNLRVRYTVASYTLLVIGLIETIIIIRLFTD